MTTTETTHPATSDTASEPTLDRELSLTSLIFYGLGVTIGAGIFALIGEILGVAGSNAPLSFLLAGGLASFTAIAYMLLVRAYPRAAGEAVYVGAGLGRPAARAVGVGVAITGTISSAVVALAFGGYLSELIDVPERLSAVALVLLLSVIAWWGIRESVLVASIVTVCELTTLVVVTAFGWDRLDSPDLLAEAFRPQVASSAILAGAVIAFFAFIGFEDIVNMAEETVNPRRSAPLAIAIVLIVSMALYVLLALIAVAAPDTGAVASSSAPMATLFEQVSGLDSSLVAAVASLAMVNGILIQILVASRVLFGMATDHLMPSYLRRLDPNHHTPTSATATVAALVIVLILFFPIVELARTTSLLTLGVFTAVNASLFVIGRSQPESSLGRYRWVGLIGAVLSFAVAVWHVATEVI